MTGVRTFLIPLVVLALWTQGFCGIAQTGPHDFQKWEKEIAAFEKMDAIHPPAQGGVVFIGSSTIRFWSSLAADYPGVPVINRGFGGSEIVDSTHFAPRILYPYHPRKVFLRAGGNDLWAGKTPDQVFHDFQDFATAVHAHLPQAIIYFISWSPSVARWREHEEERQLNALVAGYVAKTSYLIYIETYDIPLGPDNLPRPSLYRPDGLHFDAAGYRLLADRVRPYVVN